MPKALIVSVGGTAEPVARALEEHRPDVVCFVCSEDSVEKIGDVKRLAGGAGASVRSRVVVVSDPQDLVSCYRGALLAAERIGEANVPPDDVVVDYTGGTKTMSAALALATVGKGFRFSYVGGRERDKGGLGTVLSGTEEVRSGVSPWRLFAVEEKRAFADLFNRHLFASAEEVLARAVRHDAVERDLLEALLRLARAYRHWDAFRHAPAKEELAKGSASLDTWVRLRPGGTDLTAALDAARENLEFLNRLQEGTRGFKRRHRLQVADLLSNARRRAEVGRHDDAVARVYRALELLGQIAFEEVFGCETGAADPARLPESLRDEYALAYADRDGKGLRIPSFAVFRALQAAGRPEGLAYFARRADFDKLLYSRNHSILAHGFEPVAADLPDRFERLVRETFDLQEVVPFPRFVF
ncbi:MAG: TIGR02710 family CRISPR-associated protein [Deltaproteobacteria bacterium]|nr:TIGR02710 family CRISPR-associated protein [Deltaproteobacteria bacterium]